MAKDETYYEVWFLSTGAVVLNFLTTIIVAFLAWQTAESLPGLSGVLIGAACAMAACNGYLIVRRRRDLRYLASLVVLLVAFAATSATAHAGFAFRFSPQRGLGGNSIGFGGPRPHLARWSFRSGLEAARWNRFEGRHLRRLAK
jgi:hypothetical protein